MTTNRPFTFAISLSVLNHLGRSLYRSFATVLGEAISNSWDADARNVWIYVNRNKSSFWIKDDGIGMSTDDFQNKFLKIGYSKRKDGNTRSEKDRPFIGRKGIGKLALLSCAARISVISKIKGGSFIGGTIDNPSLDEAITDDLQPQEYPLVPVDETAFAKITAGLGHGTVIRFENLKEGVKRSFDFLTKIIALYFRFSLLDKSFKIFLNGDEITHKDLNDLAEKTEYLWRIGDYEDPYVAGLEKKFSKEEHRHEKRRITFTGVRGFIASVKLPRDLKIMTTDERVGIDLFVNGRLRERDILKHIPTARVVENYLYGQIHFDGLDDKDDRFTTSREGVVADDPKYETFLEKFRKTLLTIVEDWDVWRRKHRKDGDPENESISKTERASVGLYNAVAEGYEPPKGSKKADQVDAWVSGLSGDATYNFGSYAECFISENLVREYIQDQKIALSVEAQDEARKWKTSETDSKNRGNISIAIRRSGGDLSYLSMDGLANLVDKRDKNKEACLARDAAEFKPMRDAVAHTALLTDEAKKKLSTVRENIKGRVKTLLSPSK
ncbi:MAG: ATP-binding protein [Planctomycetota bacterium]|nr:ATP-binding protein [Planctomycetota bacterium]